MTAPSREKIALVVFVLLVIVGMGLLIAYLNVGHSWNVTASQIDDATGELEGYTVVLYAGTAIEEEEDESKETRETRQTDAAADKESEEPAKSARDGDALLSDGASSGEPDESASVAEETADDSISATETAEEASASVSAREGAVTVSASAEDGATDAESESLESAESSKSASMSGGTMPLFRSTASSSSASEEKEPVSVDDVAEAYREKGADVLVLDVEDFAAYEECRILKVGDRRIGVFSVAFNEPLPNVQDKADYLKLHEVDFIVAITPDNQFVKKATGIDIAISLQNEGTFFMGETVNGTFHVDSPFVGQVGAILVSPHNVVSAKDIEEL